MLDHTAYSFSLFVSFLLSNFSGFCILVLFINGETTPSPFYGDSTTSDLHQIHQLVKHSSGRIVFPS